MMAQRLGVVVFAAVLAAALGCSGDSDITVSPNFACTDGDTPVANSVTMACGAATFAAQQVDVVIDGPSTLSGLSFNVTYDGDTLAYDSFDASAASQLFPGALISVAPSTEPNSVPGYKDVVVAIQMTGGAPLIDVSGRELVVSLTFTRASAATFGPSPVGFNTERTLTATPVTAGTTFASNLMVSYQ